MPVATTVMPCRFKLYRHRDATGVSGTGVVAWGTVYPNGKVSLAWCGARPSVNVYESLADVTAIHGHDGFTQVIMCDELPLSDGMPLSNDMPLSGVNGVTPGFDWC